MASRDPKTANSLGALAPLKRIVDRRLEWLNHQTQISCGLRKESPIRDTFPWGGVVLRLIPQIESAFGAAVATKWQNDAEWLYSHAKPGTYYPDRERKFLNRIQMLLDSDLPAEDPVASQPSRKRGRPPIDKKADCRVYDGWKMSGCTSYASYGLIAQMTAKEVRLAIGRERKERNKTRQ